MQMKKSNICILTIAVLCWCAQFSAPAQPMPGPPVVEVNYQYFHDQLAPWGTWIQHPAMGWVWRPADVVIQASPGWRPYYDNGQWIQTDNGLFWQSDYRWGDIPF